MTQRVLPILAGIVRRQELDTYQDTLPRLLSQGKAVDEITATAEVRSVLDRVRSAMAELELGATHYDEAEAELDKLTAKALTGSKYALETDSRWPEYKRHLYATGAAEAKGLDSAEGEGRR